MRASAGGRQSATTSCCRRSPVPYRELHNAHVRCRPPPHTRSTQKDNVEADLKKIWNDWLKPTLQQWPSSSDDDQQRSDKKRKRKRAASEDSAVSVSDLVLSLIHI